MTIHSLGNSGFDYSDLQAWDDAAPADISATGTADIWKGEIHDEMTWNLNLTLGGTTTDAAHYKWLAAAATRSFADDPTAALRYTSLKAGMTGAVGTGVKLLLVTDAFTLIERLQFRQTATAGPPSQSVELNGKSCTFRKNIVDAAQANPAVQVTATVSGSDTIVANNVIVTRNGSADVGIYNSGTKTLHAIGNTIFNLGAGATESKGIKGNTSYSINVAIDNTIFGYASANAGGTNTGTDYNATDAASMLGGGTHNLVSKTASAQFRDVNSATLDLRPAASGSDIAVAGQRQQTYTGDLDIYDVARSTTTPTIGAAELASVVLVDYFIGSVIAAGGWTNSTDPQVSLNLAVDETVRDDTDYIQSAVNPSGDVAELKFLNVQTPNLSTSHTVSYVIKGDAGTNLRVDLVCNTTIIKTWTHNPAPTTFTRFDQTLTSTEAGTIANYSDLRLRLTAG